MTATKRTGMMPVIASRLAFKVQIIIKPVFVSHPNPLPTRSVVQCTTTVLLALVNMSGIALLGLATIGVSFVRLRFYASRFQHKGRAHSISMRRTLRAHLS